MDDPSKLGLEQHEFSKTFVKSGARAIAVLEYFYRTRKPARATDICHDLKLPVSSTKYLLSTLVETGYLTFNNKTKKYFPSILLVGFAGWLTTVYPKANQLMALAKSCHKETGESVAITVQHNYRMHALITETGDSRSTIASDFDIPIVGTASGGIILASKTDMEVLEIVRRVTRKKPIGLREKECDKVLALVRRFRQQGYAYNYGNVLPNYRGLAISLPNMDINVPMALGISGPISHIAGKEEKLVGIMQEIVSLVSSPCP